ncbi:MAG: hypothetical protein N2663_01380 [Chlorobi bacterium]|nr:hypothetical protein [Chlorobiota bacterium]
MHQSSFLLRIWQALLLIVMLILAVEDGWAQRRGSSFGGSRGTSRSYSMPRSAPPTSSFGRQRSLRSEPVSPPSSFGQSRMQPAQLQSSRASVPRSIAGTPLSTPENYRRSYGIPRRQEVRTLQTPEGQRNAIVHSYGGYGDGLLMGYLMGQTSWLWFTPFHPAFYYSQPYYVPRPDGTVEYYPPTFSLAKLFFVLIVIGALAFIVWVIVRNRRLQRQSFDDKLLSRSSFGG